MMNRFRSSSLPFHSWFLPAMLIQLAVSSATTGHAFEQDGAEAQEAKKTILLGHPANWEARFLRGSLTRSGDQFFAAHLTEEMSEEEYAEAITSVMSELESANTLIIHQAQLREGASADLQAAIVDRVKGGHTNLVFLATGAGGELADADSLKPEFVALSPVTEYERVETEDSFTSCLIEIENHPVEFDSASLLRNMTLSEDAKVLTKIIVEEESYPWIVRRDWGEGTVTFVACDDLWRIRGNSTRAYETVWRSLIQ